MNSYRLILIFCIFFLRAISSGVLGQDCEVLGTNSDFNQIRTCAPVNVDWMMEVSGVDPGSSVRFIYDWGGDPSDPLNTAIVNTTETAPGVYTADNRVYHTYPKGGNQCSYSPQVFLEVNGNMCATPLLTPSVKVHDIDIFNGGELLLEPVVYRVCAGTEATVTFEDLSRWNCTPPDETDDVNDETRWVQFIYNTHTDPGTRIQNVEVDGNLINISDEFSGPIELMPKPATGSDAVSLPIYVPSSANVGEIFEITLRNWNKCNPYDADLKNGALNPADLIDGDSIPVTTIAHIVVVAPPEAEFVPRAASGAPEETQFCPDETIYLDNMTTTHGGAVAYNWKFYALSTGNEVTPDLKYPNSSDVTTSFSTAGQYRVVLEAIDNAAAGACISTYADTIEIIATPIATMKVYDEANTGITDLHFCETATPRTITIRNETVEPPGAVVVYDWILERVDPVDSSLVSFLSSETTGEMSFNYFDQPGLYRATLTATDNITGCYNTEILYLAIHNTPKAEFAVSSSTELCVGREVLLEDLSENFTTDKSGFAEDTIRTWNWYIDGSLLASADTAGLKHVFPNVRDYVVELEVISASGCSDRYAQTLTVNPVPVAAFTLSPDEVCAGEPVTFTNGSAPQPAEVNVDHYTWYVYDIVSGTLVHQHDQLPTETSYEYVFSYNKTDNTPQLFSVYLEAFDQKGCSTLSDPDTVTVHPGVQARFHAQNYDPLESNCEVLTVDFAVDQATQDLPFTKDYRWTVYDEENTLIYDSGEVSDITLTHTFENHDSTSYKEYRVELQVIPQNPIGCISPFSTKIRVNPLPSAKFAATTVLDCEYLLLDLNAYQKGLSNYQWTVDADGRTAENLPVQDDQFTLNFKRESTPYYIDVRLETTNFAGCDSQWDWPAPVLVPALENVEASFSYTPDGSCVPVTGTFTNTSTAGAVYELWIARGSNPPVAVTPGGDLAGTFTYEFTTPGEYAVTLKVNKDGCEIDSTKTVTIAPNPTADFATGVSEACSGEYITLTDRSSGNGSTIVNKEWTITNLTHAGVNDYGPDTDPKTNHQFINRTGVPEEYEIFLEVTTAEGCSDTISRKVTIYPEPDLDFELAGGDGCSYIFTFDNNSVNAAGVQYIWNWGDGNKDTTDTEASMTHKYVNRNAFRGTDTYFVTLEVVGANGCRKTSDPIQVDLNPEVAANLVPDATKGCAPLTVNFDDFSMADPAITWEYKKIYPVMDGGYTTFPGDDFRATMTFENTTSDSIVYRVRNIATGTGGCMAMDSTEITVYPEITAGFSFTTLESCSPVEITFDNLSVKEDVQYIWSWGDGTENDTTYSQAAIDHLFENSSFTNTRDYRVRLVARDTATGCSAFFEKTVTVYPAILADVRSDKTEGCAPLDVQFRNFSLGATGHEWFYINRTTGARVAGSELATPDAFYTFENTTEEAIVYDVVYQGKKGICGDYDTVAITVYPQITAGFSASPDKQNLPDATVTVTNETRDGDTYEYFWDFGDGTGTSAERNPAPYEYATYGTFIITLSVTDQYGRCESTDSDTVVIQPTIPVVDFEYAPESGCSPLTVHFINKSKFADKNSYRWDFGDNQNSYSTEENPTYTYYQPGTYTVTLTASNEIGFTVTETKVNIIKVYDNPRALFQLRFYEVALHEEIQINNRSIGADTYYWDFGDGHTSREAEPTHTYDHPGQFDITLVATSADGCSDTLKVEGGIKASSAFDIDVPNAFAPHGSIGENAVFLPHINKAVSQYNLLIYNRWGELLFETKNREIGWNGYYKGQLSPQDVYIYKLKVTFSDGEETVRVGDVTLIR